MSRKYDLLAIDLDGTLLCSKGRVSDTNLNMIRRAKAAGMMVSVCTGRGYNECKHITQQIEQHDPVVVAGGAIVSEVATGRTLKRFPMGRPLVSRLVDTLTKHDHAALVLKDPCGVRDSGVHDGHDYLIVSPRGIDAVDPISRWWFKEHKIGVHVVPSLEHDAHPELTVRVGVCGTKRRTQAAADELRIAFAGEVVFHHFGAVVPGTNGQSEDDQIVILEAFDRQVNKWTAIEWVAEQHGIDPTRIAAIGNDVNDVAMLQAAGLGVAMGNAIPEAKKACGRETLANDDHGVAHAIERILSGEW